MTTEQKLDMDARYKVDGWGAIVVWIDGYVKEVKESRYVHVCDEIEEECPALSLNIDCQNGYFDEPEEVFDESRVNVVMVGDNKRHIVDIEDLIKIEDDDYCHSCGQIGCGHG